MRAVHRVEQEPLHTPEAGNPLPFRIAGKVETEFTHLCLDLLQPTMEGALFHGDDT